MLIITLRCWQIRTQSSLISNLYLLCSHDSSQQTITTPNHTCTDKSQGSHLGHRAQSWMASTYTAKIFAASYYRQLANQTVNFIFFFFCFLIWEAGRQNQSSHHHLKVEQCSMAGVDTDTGNKIQFSHMGCKHPITWAITPVSQLKETGIQK